MASHVVVIDASLRRVTVKTTPATHLSNVLDEACSKLALDPQQHSLKHNNKPVDLSRTMRLSGLSSGAKLSIVQASRSPSVVSVALQLPTEGDSTGTLARLTDKFPSNTSIWQVLRRFEAGAAGASSSTSRHNFTQRATPLIPSGGASGSGRLCYEMPVVNIMGRELASFVDLQKTLGQLGLNNGSCLLRLSYRNTQKPLEEAMTEISQYFKDSEDSAAAPTTNKNDRASAPESEPAASASRDMTDTAAKNQQSQPPETAPVLPTPAVGNDTNASAETGNTTSVPTVESEQVTSTASGISIFAPPSSNTPAAASQADYNEADYVPTIVHAQQHQARLASESRNRKLLSDAELASQQESRTNALSLVKEVVVRFRFPDQSQAQKSFGQDATSSSLYDFCRELMNRPGGEGFSIKVVGGKAATEAVQENSSSKLIQTLGWQGRVLVTVVWADNVSAEARRRPCLKEQYRRQAEALKVDLQQASQRDEAEQAARPSASQQQKAGDGGVKKDVESKMRGFLKGLSRK